MERRARLYLLVVLDEEMRLRLELVADIGGDHAVGHDHTLDQLADHCAGLEHRPEDTLRANLLLMSDCRTYGREEMQRRYSDVLVLERALRLANVAEGLPDGGREGLEVRLEQVRVTIYANGAERDHRRLQILQHRRRGSFAYDSNVQVWSLIIGLL